MQIIVFSPRDASNPGILYAGTFGGGICKTRNAGLTWRPINNGLTDTCVFAIAVDHLNPAILYTGSRNGVFKSIDGGAHWVPMNRGLKYAKITALASTSRVQAPLFAGSEGGILYKKTNNGEWVSLNEPFWEE